ncbi:MAG: pseudouridine synthase [Bacteroidaceae bacterium]|nr:pseudouridine synthase [Bacteroidaceae bacterium]MCF0228364.1 pseudouridine synthase [Parasporobacterium sp.]
MNKLSKKIITENSSDKTEEMRLNKFLADAGICSRREADRMIESGKVKVDGITAVMGQRVMPGQNVTVDGKEVSKDDRLVIIAFNKPAGIECTTSDRTAGNIIDYIKYPVRIFPVGRLDRNSTGLILLTNAGELSDRILRSSNHHEKEYEVTVNRPLTREFIKNMQDGVEIEQEDGRYRVMTRPCRLEATGKCSFNIVLTQGLNRQIRRMCSELGYKVISLKRIRIININLGNLSEGHYRNLTEAEVRKLMKELNKAEGES